MNFFDDYPRFYQTSETSPFPDRLNARHMAIIQSQAEHFAGARVLDIACHDGRWTFAALAAGAAHVTGIEPRQELLDNAKATLSGYGIPADRHEFICGDVFETLGAQPFDVVLCLGFYYHTIRHAELLDRIERTGARLVVIDTEVTPRQETPPPPVGDDPRLVFGNPNGIQLLLDPVENQQMACHDRLTRRGRTLVGRPSRAAVAFLAEHFGYRCDTYDWPAHFSRFPGHAASMVDYSEGWRDTFYLSR